MEAPFPLMNRTTRDCSAEVRQSAPAFAVGIGPGGPTDAEPLDDAEACASLDPLPGPDPVPPQAAHTASAVVQITVRTRPERRDLTALTPSAPSGDWKMFS
jgi:hypothetical protein